MLYSFLGSLAFAVILAMPMILALAAREQFFRWKLDRALRKREAELRRFYEEKK